MPKNISSSSPNGYRSPNWPVWFYRLSAQDQRIIEAGYTTLKERSGLDRASRISAADYAASVYAFLLSTGAIKKIQAAPPKLAA